MSNCHLCIHAHFYQPPRADPFTGRVPREPGAAPYANWNERITAECYAPLAEAGHFGRVSFNLGGTLARWLDEHAHATYEHIVAAERDYWQASGVGNGLAQPVHHTILPLARRRDKICQIRWGIASFAHRFGHEPLGMWLPEMAVDYETLEIMVTEGIRFTILSEEQVRGNLEAGAGPYRVRLPSGREIVLFVRDRFLSNALSFGMPDSAYVDEWLRDQVEWRCRGRGAVTAPRLSRSGAGRPGNSQWRCRGKGAVTAPLLLIATDGETFGHHHRQGLRVLDHVLSAGDAHGYTLTTLGLYLRQNPPQAEVEVIENTAWSCFHHLARWVVGCGCTPGDSRWKGALRRALDNLACDLDCVYVQEARRLGLDPWPLRDDYIAVVMGQVSGPDFLTGNGLGHLGGEEARRLLWLLETQFHRQRMYASCTFFFDDLDRHEPCYAIANGVRALALTRHATGDDLSHGFRRDLRVAVSGRTGRTAADIFDEILARAEI